MYVGVEPPNAGVVSNLKRQLVTPLELVNSYLSKILNLLSVQFPVVSDVQLEPSELYSTVYIEPSTKLVWAALVFEGSGK